MRLLDSLKRSMGAGEFAEHAAYLSRTRELSTDGLKTQPQGGAKVSVRNISRARNFDLAGYRAAYRASTNEPVRRAVIYPTMMCNERCKFCYYLDMIENPKKAPSKELPLGGARHRDLENLKLELEVYRRYYDLTHVDITGGEPTIYPDIVEMIRYASQIGIEPCIISNAQRPQIWEKLIDNGLQDALLSIHGFQEEQDHITQKKGSWRRLMQTVEELKRLDFSHRTNCVVGIWNYLYLPDLAKTIADQIGPRIHNFIVFNPHEGNQWGCNYEGERRAFDEQAGYSAIAPYLKEALDILRENGIWSNVRYMPLCLMTGYEQHVCNFYQWQFDPYEWFYHQYSHREFAQMIEAAKARGFYGDGLDAALCSIGRKETKNNVYAESCKECSVYKICDGIYPQYETYFGLDEFKPVHHPEGPIEDPMYFRNRYIGYRIPKEAWAGRSAGVVADYGPHRGIWSAENETARSLDREPGATAAAALESRAQRAAPSGFWHTFTLPDGRRIAGEKPASVSEEWARWGLPGDLTGKSFLDVGCFDGGFSLEAYKRGAAHVLAVDAVTTGGMEWLLEQGDWFEFRECGVYDPGFTELGRFDLVLCAGVYYHCSDIMQLFCNLRQVTAGELYVEGVVDAHDKSATPRFEFFPGAELNGDPTNWWRPNAAGLLAMLASCGFSARDREIRGDRMIVRATPGPELPRHNHRCSSRMATLDRWVAPQSGSPGAGQER